MNRAGGFVPELLIGCEPFLLTSGDDIAGVARFLPQGAHNYTAADIIDYLLTD